MPMAHKRAVRRQAQVSLTMELVPTTDEQLRHLAEDDPHLGPHFAGVFASDRLPRLPIRDRAQGYIVNVDPHDRPGSHWMALWTPGPDDDEDEEGGETCLVMDSFGLPLWRYGAPALDDWLKTHWSTVRFNRRSLQAIDSNTCGAYALLFLVHCSLGGTLQTFQQFFSRYDFVKNDARAAAWFKRLVRRDLAWHRLTGPIRQSNHVPVRLMDMLMTMTGSPEGQNYDTVY